HARGNQRPPELGIAGKGVEACLRRARRCVQSGVRKGRRTGRRAPVSHQGMVPGTLDPVARHESSPPPSGRTEARHHCDRGPPGRAVSAQKQLTAGKQGRGLPNTPRGHAQGNSCPTSVTGHTELWAIAMKNFLRENGLSLVLFGLFAMFFVGQAVSGLLDYNNERQGEGEPAVGMVEYVSSGDFLEATMENWESEFL